MNNSTKILFAIRTIAVIACAYAARAMHNAGDDVGSALILALACQQLLFGVLDVRKILNR